MDDQPVDDGSAGELVAGPGAGGMQPRPSEVKRALPPLTPMQDEMLKRAKRFAMEQSVQQVTVGIQNRLKVSSLLRANVKCVSSK